MALALAATERITCGACGAIINPRWGRCLACRAPYDEIKPNVPHEWAEGVAWMVAGKCPRTVPSNYWARLVVATSRFLREWGEQAHALGWDAHELFGCHRTKPYARLDCQGLVWVLVGRGLVAMTESTATLRAPIGAVQTHRRSASSKNSVECVLVWDLIGELTGEEHMDHKERAAIREIEW